MNSKFERSVRGSPAGTFRDRRAPGSFNRSGAFEVRLTGVSLRSRICGRSLLEWDYIFIPASHFTVRTHVRTVLKRR